MTSEGMTIDQLSAKTGVPSRTIRFYQSNGVLPKPDKRGRVAFYGDHHVDRLDVIATLQDRGLRISAIRTLLSRVDRGEVDVGQWLGLEEQLTAAWAGDTPRTVNKAELIELAGRERPALIGDLERVGLVERSGDAFIVRSPTLLKNAMRLEEVGLDLETAVAAEHVLRKHLERAAKDVVKLFFDEAAKGNMRPPSDGDWSSLINELRPISQDAVRVLFGQEMERVLKGAVDSGRLAKLPRRRRRRRAKAHRKR